MTNTISASNATEPSATDSARTPLEDLIARAEASSQHIGTSKRNKALIQEMAVALVSLASLNATLLKQHEDRRIILPGS